MATRVIVGCLAVAMTVGLLTTVPAAEETGQALYEGYCQTCHGVEGQSGKAPRLVPFTWTYEEALDRIRNPECEMPPFSSLDLPDAQVRQIVSYLKSLKSRP